MPRTILAAFLIVPVLTLTLLGADWPSFRGPTGSGTSDETDLPVRWSDTEGLQWKTPLPGPGSSSPIVSRGRVFVTCYSGYGVNRREPGDQEKLQRHVVCVDSKDGKVLWDRSIGSKLPEVAYGGIGVPNHGYASSTPAADGERVYAFFGRSGVVSYDYEGKEAWRAEVAPDPRTHNFGTGSSPLVWSDLVIVPASVECEALVAFDKRTGKEAWRTPATGYGAWWGTPILVGTGDEAELVVAISSEVWGLNPKNGKLRWHAEWPPNQGICTSPVAAGGVVYAVGGREGGSVAVKTGGRGDVTKSHTVWSGRTGSYVPSPVLVGAHLYWVTDRGVAHCVKVETGEELFGDRPEGQRQGQRIDGAGTVYASLVAADGKLYAVSRRSGTFVLEATPELRQLALNTFSGDDSDSNASPAVSDGRLYLRSDRFLYCVGKPKS
ncbi:MAG: PQQ-like beta-propeller repeat protein [Planctomycetes bacterium]|nr:PQQ-like beta-propeller repeat protein [Planctomycetota bacterium]